MLGFKVPVAPNNNHTSNFSLGACGWIQNKAAGAGIPSRWGGINVLIGVFNMLNAYGNTPGSIAMMVDEGI